MGWLSSLFARRYLLSKKSHTVINIISWVSAVAVAVPIAAMVILLSVFNGFEQLVKSLYNEFDPDLVVVPAEGKVFESSMINADQLLSLEGVEAVAGYIEDNALLQYRDRQFIGTVRGVGAAYDNVTGISGMISSGWYNFPSAGSDAIIGDGIAYSLGMLYLDDSTIELIVPRRGTSNFMLPLDNFKTAQITPTAFFSLDADTDGKYIITSLELAQELFDYRGKLTGYGIRLSQSSATSKIKKQISEIAGSDFKVLTRYEQKASLYKIMNYEKWGIFLIIFMVLIISSFSIIGSLVMLIIDKRSDIRTMTSLGASVDFLRAVFVKQGMIISSIGAAAGIILGLLFCFIQTQFGIITIPAETFLINTYPVKVKPTDIALIICTIIIVNYIISKFTVTKMISRSKR